MIGVTECTARPMREPHEWRLIEEKHLVVYEQRDSPENIRVTDVVPGRRFWLRRWYCIHCRLVEETETDVG